uniref:Transferrin receptor 2 n=1 Tax=Leptobrachium leishanense TaxID=445787 RepID=A0A8C5LS94_9ANUR
MCSKINVVSLHRASHPVMERVRGIFRDAVPSTNSYSIYHGVEDQEGAELQIEEKQEEVPVLNAGKKSWLPPVSPLYQKILIAIIVIVAAFILGILVTYGSCTKCKRNKPESGGDDNTYEYQQNDDEGVLHWAGLKDMFNEYLKAEEQIENTIRSMCKAPHPAGSEENKELANFILQKFKTYPLDHTWIDTHFVELQYPDRNRPNSLKLIDQDNGTKEQYLMDEQEPYCPFSKTGKVESGLVYVNYGRKEDFKSLSEFGVNPQGQLVLVRTGQISFAEKVFNAESAGALGVLIFPDTDEEISVYGHVHLGTGDPSTPGFPSFNHTQFPNFKSSGLPNIPVQPIKTSVARRLLSELAGVSGPRNWYHSSFSSNGLGPTLSKPGHRISLEVSSVRQSVELLNVFGSIAGRTEPEHYIVVGAQRDSWGPGAARSAVGTAILLELARTLGSMVKNGFQPHRSVLFVSWDAGDFGSVGATEWLEGYLSMLHLKAATYMSLDTAILGDEMFTVKSSPLFKSLVEFVIKQVDNPRRSKESIYESIISKDKAWQEKVMFPLTVDTGAFAFTAFGGVPALEFSFIESSNKYQYLDTKKDTYDSLNNVVGGRLPAVALSVAQVAGLSLIKLLHDDILPMDYTEYSNVLLQHVVKLNSYQAKLKTQGLTFDWLASARGDYTRATQTLKNAISNSDLLNEKMIQSFNVRIMRVEFYFLSQYVSAISCPYRHILMGRGEHTIQALIEALQQAPQDIDTADLRKKLALITWTLKGAANALSGEVWEIQESY